MSTRPLFTFIVAALFFGDVSARARVGMGGSGGRAIRFAGSVLRGVVVAIVIVVLLIVVALAFVIKRVRRRRTQALPSANAGLTEDIRVKPFDPYVEAVNSPSPPPQFPTPQVPVPPHNKQGGSVPMLPAYPSGAYFGDTPYYSNVHQQYGYWNNAHQQSGMVP